MKPDVAVERLKEIVAWARSRKEFIESAGFKSKPAGIDINAPRAVILAAMEAEHRALSAVLRMARGEVASS